MQGYILYENEALVMTGMREPLKPLAKQTHASVLLLTLLHASCAAQPHVVFIAKWLLLRSCLPHFMAPSGMMISTTAMSAKMSVALRGLRLR